MIINRIYPLHLWCRHILICNLIDKSTFSMGWIRFFYFIKNWVLMDLGWPYKIKIAWRWLVKDRCMDGLVNYRRFWKGLRGLMIYLGIWGLVIVGEGYFARCLFCQKGLWEILLLIEGEIGRINPNKSTCLLSNSTDEAMTVLPLGTFLLVVLMLTTRLKPNFITNLPLLKIIMRWNRRPIPINITLILILYSN